LKRFREMVRGLLLDRCGVATANLLAVVVDTGAAPVIIKVPVPEVMLPVPEVGPDPAKANAEGDQSEFEQHVANAVLERGPPGTMIFH
jgi:hypothetical protein